jgi:DNA-binding NarL/FixJ family response regulator
VIVALLGNSDLFFAARLQETAKAAGIEIVIVAPARGVEVVNARTPRLVIVDLTAPGVMEAIRKIRDAMERPKILGYYPHVSTALRDEALAAGVDEVLPQSAFTARLSRILTDARGA